MMDLYSNSISNSPFRATISVSTYTHARVEGSGKQGEEKSRSVFKYLLVRLFLILRLMLLNEKGIVDKKHEQLATARTEKTFFFLLCFWLSSLAVLKKR